MSQRSIRFPDDVEAALEAEAAGLEDRSFSWVVIKACREHLERESLLAQYRVHEAQER